MKLSFSGLSTLFPQLASLTKKWMTSPFFSPLLRWLVALAAIFPVGYTTYRHWAAVQQTLLQVQWPFLLVSAILLFSSMPLMGVIPWLTLRYLNIERPLPKIVGLYFASQLTKYLPGGIWAYPTRVAAYQVNGINHVLAMVSVAREVIVLFLGAALLASLAPLTGVPFPYWMQILLYLGVLGCFLIAALTFWPKAWGILSKFRPIRSLGQLPKNIFALTGFQLVGMLVSLLTSGIYWLVAGISFWFLIRAVNPAPALQGIQAITIFALAWCVGFTIIILPAGFGARETAILYLLQSFVGPADAVAISLLARLCWMAVEALWTILLAGKMLPHKRDLKRELLSKRH